MLSLASFGEKLGPNCGAGIGDRGYWDPAVQTPLRQCRGFELLAPFRKKSSDP